MFALILPRGETRKSKSEREREGEKREKGKFNKYKIKKERDRKRERENNVQIATLRKVHPAACERKAQAEFGMHNVTDSRPFQHNTVRDTYISEEINSIDSIVCNSTYHEIILLHIRQCFDNNWVCQATRELCLDALDMRSPPSGWSGGCSYSRGWHLRKKKKKEKGRNEIIMREEKRLLIHL